MNEREARTVEAIAARIFPGDAADPGAREAGVVAYVERALAEASCELRDLYRRSLAEVDRRCVERHDVRFVELSEEIQDAVLGELEREPADSLLARFFATACQHTIEGMFSDPMYGGNRDAVGWRLLGFPGAQWAYSAEERRAGFDAATMPTKTLDDLRRERDAAP